MFLIIMDDRCFHAHQVPGMLTVEALPLRSSRSSYFAGQASGVNNMVILLC